MEILLNELSLEGQYGSVEEFCEDALLKIVKIFKELKDDEDLVFKKYEFYSYKVTSELSIHDVLTGPLSRTYDVLRRLKLFLHSFFKEPYWENDSQQKECDYIFEDDKINTTSIAEAYERDRMIISFKHHRFLMDSLEVNGGDGVRSIFNLKEANDLLRVKYDAGRLALREYCSAKFSNGSKLDFSEVDLKESFGLLSKMDEKLFLEGFNKFDSLEWQQIFSDDGLDYKEYSSRNFYRSIESRKHKFRISQRYRCFGYVKEGVFYVLCFDLTHKLSD